MSSKQLDSILSKTPSATVKEEAEIESQNKIFFNTKEATTRIVASIPVVLKEEIRDYIKVNKGETEKTVLLKSLKKMGFNVNPAWIVDKRSLR